MKSSVIRQVGDHKDVNEEIVEAEIAEEDVAEIRVEELDEKRHLQQYRSQVQNIQPTQG